MAARPGRKSSTAITRGRTGKINERRKRLLIVYHSKGGSTWQMARSVEAGARGEELAVDVRCKLAREAGLDDLLWCDALVLGTPENFGYMSGGLKDFFDRTYYPAGDRLEGLPVAIFICAGNDGGGALESIRRIIRGFPLQEVQEAIVCQGGVTPEILDQCRELGMGMAAGVEAGIF
ncbi:MAG: flavodoxin family protein [Pseudomonadales bacterium]|nr:flavodoxin family protein [Pseudomonadales bacterium]